MVAPNTLVSPVDGATTVARNVLACAGTKADTSIVQNKIRARAGLACFGFGFGCFSCFVFEFSFCICVHLASILVSVEGSILFLEGHWTVVALMFGVVVHTNAAAEMKPELSHKADGCFTFWAECLQNQWFRCVDHGHVWLVDLCDKSLSTRIFSTQAKQGALLPGRHAEISLASSNKRTQHQMYELMRRNSPLNFVPVTPGETGFSSYQFVGRGEIWTRV